MGQTKVKNLGAVGQLPMSSSRGAAAGRGDKSSVTHLQLHGLVLQDDDRIFNVVNDSVDVDRGPNP